MSNKTVTSYDPQKVNVIVAGRVITGFASDGVVNLTRNSDSVTPAVGAKGDVAYSENADETGTVALTLMSTSASLAYLRELEAKRKMVSVSVQDKNDSDGFVMACDNCRVLKMPDANRAKDQGTVTVNIYVPSMVLR